MADDKDLNKSLEAAQQRPVRAGKLTPAKKEASAPAPGAKGPGNIAARLNPAAHQQATKQVVVNDDFDYDTAMHMAFIGAGQGGSRIANSFWKLGYRRVGIFNTTESDFEGLEAEIPKLSLDIGGAAKDMKFARQALDGRTEEIWDLMIRSWGNNPDCALVCVGLGGGSGSGCALPIVQLARKYMEAKNRPPRVGAIVSLPSVTEGQIVARNAVTAFGELLQAKVSPLLIIDNSRVHSLYRPSMSQLLPKSNELVSQMLHLFNQLAAIHSPHITFDRNEFAQLLDGGICVMGCADINKLDSPADISAAIRDELAQSILAEVDLRRGRKAACLFVGHQDILDSLDLDYFDAGFTTLDRIVGSAYQDKDKDPTVIHRGLYPGVDAGLQCYTMISELDPPRGRLQELAKKGGLAVTQGASVAKHLGVGD